MWKWLEVSSLFEVLDWYAQLTRISCRTVVSNYLQTDKKVITYRLVDTSAIQGLHGAFCCSRVVVFDKAVVETFGLEVEKS